MKTRYRYMLYTSTIGDIKNLEQHFTKMAARGWMIDKYGMLIHRYRACTPCEKRFYVDLLPQITAFDYPDNKDAQSYRQLCEDSGWTFISSSRQIHVFSADEDAPAVPIHTDDSVQAKIYKRACFKYELLPYILFTLLLGYQMYNIITQSGYNVIVSNLSIFLLLGFALFLPVFAWILAATLTWYVRAAIAARRGQPMPVMSRLAARVRAKLLILTAALFFLLILFGVILEIINGESPWTLLIFFIPFSGVGLGMYMRRRLNKRERRREENIRSYVYMCIVLFFVLLLVPSLITPAYSPRESDLLEDRPVLTLSDFGIANPQSSSYANVQGSFLVPLNYSYWETSRQGSIDMSVHRPVSDALARGLFEYRIKAQADLYERYASGYQLSRLSSEDAATWGADECAIISRPGVDSLMMYLLCGRTVLRLEISIDSVTRDEEAEAVRALWDRLLEQ